MLYQFGEYHKHNAKRERWRESELIWIMGVAFVLGLDP